MVFELNKQKKPVNMCSEAKARYLLKNKYAAVHKIYPFTIRLKDNIDCPSKLEYKVKIDPGSKYTGLSLIDQNNNVTFLAEIEHRGDAVKTRLDARRGARRSRRQRETRYRHCKFINRKLKKGSKYKVDSNRPEGWIPPSIKSVEQNIVNWVIKLSKLCNITSVSIESVKFDSQLMDNPNISGIEYQQGTLFGFEVREYLLEKYGHKCQYCGGVSGDSILQIEHMISKFNKGTNSVKNLCISCSTCNQDKGSLNLDQWLEVLKNSKKTILTKARIENIEKVLKDGLPSKSKRYSAWVNSYRWNLVNNLKRNFSNLELSSGGRTKFNRTNLKLPKEHYYDATCVGEISDNIQFKTDTVLKIKAYGRGSRFRGRTNKCGIITKHLSRQKSFFNFQTGDLVKSIVTKGKKIGTYVGRIAVRSSGFFNITTDNGVIQGIKYDTMTLIQRNDGYSYSIEKRNKNLIS